MNYPRSEKYLTADLMAKIMGPNPIKLEEELLPIIRLPKMQPYATSEAVRD